MRLFSIILLLAFTHGYGQFYRTHYVAPAPWQYVNDAFEFVIATNTTGIANVVVKKSDGTFITNLTTSQGSPTSYRPTIDASICPRYALDTVLNDAGLIFTSTIPISVNLRNIASDQIPNGGDGTIVGNASLTSFGNPGIGTSFRVGYYRDDANPNTIYSIMSLYDNNQIRLNGNLITTLNTGQSYLFNAPMGSLVEGLKSCVMNTSTFTDIPGGCGDGSFDQIPPIQVLENHYIVVRTLGSTMVEQSTIVATENNTTITLTRYNASGALFSTTTFTLPLAGNFTTIENGDGVDPNSIVDIISNKKIAVFVGSGNSCEVDVSTSIPVASVCRGSNFVETKKFIAYDNSDLPYYGYVILQHATEIVNVNGVNVETLSSPRIQLGTSGWFLITFTSDQILNPSIISISSLAKLNISLIQLGGGFSMSAVFSSFIEQPDTPSVLYVSSPSCPNTSATLTTSSSATSYQWYLNGVLIPDANAATYNASISGNYYVTAILACGETTQSAPVSVTINSIASPTAISPQSFCNSAVVSDLVATGTAIQWYLTPTGGTPLPPNTPLINGTTYYASQTISSCESERSSVQITIIAPEINQIAAIQYFCQGGTVGELLPQGIDIFWYDSLNSSLPLDTSDPLVNNQFYFASRFIDPCESIERIEVRVFTDCEIPKGISPNGDGKNDTFDLSFLNGVALQIFNRYGMEIYSKSNYHNEWDGKDYNNTTLPTGVYYYIVKNSIIEIKTGWVYLVTE
jgi:gliding motility-associated-like protein